MADGNLYFSFSFHSEHLRRLFHELWLYKMDAAFHNSCCWGSNAFAIFRNPLLYEWNTQTQDVALLQ